MVVFYKKLIEKLAIRSQKSAYFFISRIPLEFGDVQSF